MDNLPQYYSFFGNSKEIFNKILNNDLQLSGENIFEKIFELFGLSLKNLIPHVSLIMGITIILSIIERLNLIEETKGKPATMGGKIIFSVLLITSSMIFINNAKECLVNISEFTQVLMPFLITFLASSGAQGSVSILGPTQVMMSSVLINLCVNVVFPLIVVGFIVTSINGILPDNKLNGISVFLKNSSIWLIGGIFTVFSAIIAIQGISASITDGISIRSIKYALSSSVPVIGSSISDSVSAVLLSAFSIKGAAGIMGIIIITGIVISPIISLWVYIFVLSCFCACVQPFSSSFIVEQINKICDFLKLSATVLLGVSVLWFIYLGVLVCAGGNFI